MKIVKLSGDRMAVDFDESIKGIMDRGRSWDEGALMALSYRLVHFAADVIGEGGEFQPLAHAIDGDGKHHAVSLSAAFTEKAKDQKGEIIQNALLDVGAKTYVMANEIWAVAIGVRDVSEYLDEDGNIDMAKALGDVKQPKDHPNRQSMLAVEGESGAYGLRMLFPIMERDGKRHLDTMSAVVFAMKKKSEMPEQGIKGLGWMLDDRRSVH